MAAEKGDKMDIKKCSPYIFSFGHFVNDWCQGAIPALLPYFIVHYGLSYKEAGTIIFMNVLIASVVQPLFGYYSDRISRPWFVLLGPLLCGTAVTAMGFVDSYPLILAAALVGGVGTSLFHPEAALMVSRFSGKAKGKAMGIFAVGGNAGFGVGPLMAGFCAYHLGIRSLVLMGAINVLAVMLLFVAIKKLTAAETEEKIREKKKAAQAAENDWVSFGKLSFCILARSAGFMLSNTFIPLLWIYILHGEASQGTTALSALFLMGACCTYAGGLLADKIGFRKVILIAFAIEIPTYFLLTNTDSMLLVMLLLVPAAMAVFSPFSPMVVLGQNYLARNAGFASGVTLGLSTTLGGMVTPLVGWAADTWGLQTALQALWIAGVIGLVAGFTLPDDRRKDA